MDISKLELNWEKVSWDISSRIGTDMSKITEWGSLFYLDKDVPPKVVVEEVNGKCKIQIKDLKTYAGDTFPPNEMKRAIVKTLATNYMIHKDKYNYLLLDEEYNLFAGRENYSSEWTFLGKKDGKDWKALSFSTFCDWFTEYGAQVNGKDLYWRVGNHVFRTTSMYLEKVLGAIVLSDYCDRFVPKKTGEVKVVSLNGFSVILMFLRKIMGDKRTMDTATLRSLYNDFDRAKCIPTIPARWKQDDIELMNMRRLDLVIEEVGRILEKEMKENEEKESETKKSENNSEIESQVDLVEEKKTTNSGEVSITEKLGINSLLQNAKTRIQSQINFAKADEKHSSNSINTNTPLKLSKILSGQTLLNSDIWVDEYLVDIDTNITEGGISIGEHEMLVSIISYGFLQILVEDGVQPGLCKELEDILEEKYGVATKFLGLEDENAREILKKGSKTNVTTEA